MITGASAGLGRATAREFGKHRAHVGLIARGVEGLEAAKREIESSGGKAMVLPLDVANAEAIDQTDEPENPDRPDNLRNPVDGDHGAHGTFDRRARKSWELQASANRLWLAVSLAAAIAACFLSLKR